MEAKLSKPWSLICWLSIVLPQWYRISINIHNDGTALALPSQRCKQLCHGAASKPSSTYYLFTSRPIDDIATHCRFQWCIKSHETHQTSRLSSGVINWLWKREKESDSCRCVERLGRWLTTGKCLKSAVNNPIYNKANCYSFTQRRKHDDDWINSDS